MDIVAFSPYVRFIGEYLPCLICMALFSHTQMAAEPLTSEAIALTEKKMDMSLGVHFSTNYIFLLAAVSLLHSLTVLFRLTSDDIIKMSKTRAVKPNKQRVSVRLII